ncbi:MAG TPA: hypothetical protein VGO47_05840 [Chlamydiales bacterium]|jgi:hypothetical protein|nr:hypothetical protein [Chlamydiales bacterium]
MTTTISEQIISMASRMTISDAQYAAFNQNIDRKLAERVWTAKDANSQTALNEISKLYKKAIEDHKANLKTQYDLGKKMIEQVASEQNLGRIPTILQEFQTAIQPILMIHKQLEMTIEILEGRITSLLPADTRFAKPT